SSMMLVGCAGGAPAPGEETVGAGVEAYEALNGITTNGITTNGITTNGITTNGITTNGITTNSLVMSALLEESNRTILQYIASCALPSSQRFYLDVGPTRYWFEGAIGLAPDWGLETGSCGDTCQAWVSACLIARINAVGHSVPLSLRGDGVATTEDELTTYT